MQNILSNFYNRSTCLFYYFTNHTNHLCLQRVVVRCRFVLRPSLGPRRQRHRIHSCFGRDRSWPLHSNLSIKSDENFLFSVLHNCGQHLAFGNRGNFSLRSLHEINRIGRKFRNLRRILHRRLAKFWRKTIFFTCNFFFAIYFSIRCDCFLLP